jgi:hypothetical protein
MFTGRTIVTLGSMMAVDMTEVLFSTTATLLAFCFLHNMRASALIDFLRSRVFIEVTLISRAASLTGFAVMLLHFFHIIHSMMHMCFVGVVSVMSVMAVMTSMMPMMRVVPVMCFTLHGKLLLTLALHQTAQ